MSRAVEFIDIRRRIEEFGDRATVVTVSPELRPHVVTAVVECVDEALRIRVGSRTRANLLERPQLTLTWPPRGDGEYQLILDGDSTAVGQPDVAGVSTVTIAVHRGILHRLAELAEPGPSCVALSES